MNDLAFNHTIVLEPTDDKKIRYCSCDISNGSLRILFAKQYLSYNTNDATLPEKIAQAVNNAGIATSSGSGTGIPLDFDAKSSIRSEYESKIGDVKKKLEKVLGLPVLTLSPNFEHNFTVLSKHAQAGGSEDLQREWQKRFGMATLSYFEGLAHQLDCAGFVKDEMMQEGFHDAVEKNEIQLRVVDRMVKGTYNEVIIENGVLIMQTIAKKWATNTSQVGQEVLEIL